MSGPVNPSPPPPPRHQLLAYLAVGLVVLAIGVAFVVLAAHLL